jgi:predicted permease
MNNILTQIGPVLQQLIIVVILVGIGSGGRAIRILNPDHATLLNTIAMTFLMPALVFANIIGSHRDKLDINLFKIPLVAFLVIALSGVIAFATGKLLKLPRKRMGAFLLTAMFGSTAFIGLPIIKGVNKDAILQHTFYSELGSLVLLVTIGIIIASFYGEGSRFSTQNLLAIPRSGPFIAMVLALLFYNDNVPDWLLGVLNTLAGATLPIMMFSLGITIVWKDVRDHFLQILSLNGIKLLLAPLLGIGLARMFGLDSTTTFVIGIDAATPAIVLCLAYAAQYKLDVEFASEAVFSSFFFCVFTIPLIAILLPH